MMTLYQTLWIQHFKHYGFTPFKNLFSHTQQNKTHTTIQSLDDTSHTTIQSLDDTSHKTFWMTLFKQHDSTFSLMFNKLKPIQSYNLWMTPPIKHSGFSPFKNRYNREKTTPFKNPFSQHYSNTYKCRCSIPHSFLVIEEFLINASGTFFGNILREHSLIHAFIQHMDDDIVSNNMDSTLSLVFNKIKPIQLYNLWIKTFWMTPFTHSG